MKCLIVAALTTIAMVAGQTTTAPMGSITVTDYANAGCTGAAHGPYPIAQNTCGNNPTPNATYLSYNFGAVGKASFAKVYYHAGANCMNTTYANEAHVPCGQCMLSGQVGYYQYNCHFGGGGNVRVEYNCNEGCGTCANNKKLDVGQCGTYGEHDTHHIKLAGLAEAATVTESVWMAANCSGSPAVTNALQCGACYGSSIFTCSSSVKPVHPMNPKHPQGGEHHHLKHMEGKKH